MFSIVMLPFFISTKVIFKWNINSSNTHQEEIKTVRILKNTNNQQECFMKKNRN